MAWDKDLPDGDVGIDLGDDAIRANNAAAETAFDLEHRFATGGNQSGRHTFVQDTTVNLDALSDTDAGSIGFSTDERSGYYVGMIHDGSNFESMDVEPVDGSGNPTLPRVNAPSKFTRLQWALVYNATGDIVSATPDTLEIDLEQGPFQYATLTNDTLITGVSSAGNQSGYSTTLFLEVIQGGGGGHLVTFNSPSPFIAPYGVAPIVNQLSGYRTVLQFTKSHDGLWVVSSLPGLAAF